MEILDSENTLHDILIGLSNMDITIVTAFATKTEELLNILIENNNRITLAVGTINHFTDPEFISHCLLLSKQKNLNFTATSE